MIDYLHEKKAVKELKRVRKQRDRKGALLFNNRFCIFYYNRYNNAEKFVPLSL
jgi:hypothetical protein